VGEPGDHEDALRIGRRSFMAGVVAVVAAAAACGGGGGDDDRDGDGAREGDDAQRAADLPPVPADLAADVFALGVASGDPLPDSVILWTRLVADPTVPGGAIGTADPVPVAWEVATDEGFDDVVAEGANLAEEALGHSVHVDVTGLEPDTWYWYRFTIDDRTSPVGRARTTPAADDEPDVLRFAFASCQNRQDGFWTAHDHLAEEDVDLVFFLGDYIYEGPPEPGSPQPYATAAPTDLPGYRARWAEYKADPALQAGHAARPWVCTWDDHEVGNDYAGDVAFGMAADDGAARERFLAQRSAAYQAFYEHQPVRIDPPDGADLRIYRSVDWGTLARFYVLDGRQYRSDQECGATAVVAGAGPLCPEAEAEDRTMLGTDQEAWLGDELAASGARWNVLAQQTVVAHVPFAADLVNLDQWDGYPAARARLLDQLAGVTNPVVITGDIHLAAAGTIESAAGEPVAAELVGTSISSSFPLADAIEGLVSELPNVQHINARQRGYVVCEVTADELRADFRVVSTVEEQQATVATDVSLLIADGDPVPRPV
jgi:alkaline phosphatase D